MTCIYCDGPTHVVQTRPAGRIIRRLRKCDAVGCERQFITYESIRPPDPNLRQDVESIKEQVDSLLSRLK